MQVGVFLRIEGFFFFFEIKRKYYYAQDTKEVPPIYIIVIS